MSAYIVSKKHVDFIVSAAHLWSRGNVGRYLPRGGGIEACAKIGRVKDPIPFEDFTSTDLGKLLWSENFASYSARYDTIFDTDERRDLDTYKFAMSAEVANGAAAVKVIKAIRCLEYQSCEHDGWESSAAHHFCKALINEAISHLPGYSEAAWEVA